MLPVVVRLDLFESVALRRFDPFERVALVRFALLEPVALLRLDFRFVEPAVEAALVRLAFLVPLERLLVFLVLSLFVSRAAMSILSKPCRDQYS